MIIDTPGIKELQLWADEADLNLIYPDIIELESRCQYKNCSHSNEKGCAIKDAMERGELSREKYKRYKKMLNEVRRLAERKSEYNSKVKNKGKRK